MSRLHQFWIGWRKEIVRGGLIFAAVLGIGLAATRMWGRIPFNVANGFNWDDFGSSFEGGRDDRNWHESFRWAGTIAPTQWIWIRNTNGPVLVEPSEGDSVVVVADKRYRRSNPNGVEIRVVEHNGTVTICALWRADQAECGENGEYRLKNTKRNDLAVRFRVMLPKGVKLDASTVNGPMEVDGTASALALATVNGGIEANASGPIWATTVNGSIHATIASLGCCEAVELKTVNGGIHAELPAHLNADLEASTVSGRVSTDLPIQLVGRVSPRQIKARIGKGGRRLAMSTVNGSIEITQHDHETTQHDHERP